MPRLRWIIFVAVLIPLGLASYCRSRHLTEEGIEACLVRTDFIGHDKNLRAAIGWFIEYDRKLRGTTCCALQPRADVLAKRSDLAAFKEELLKRIDLLETNSSAGSPTRTELREKNPCYGALMDIYHDVHYATRRR